MNEENTNISSDLKFYYKNRRLKKKERQKSIHQYCNNL